MKKYVRMKNCFNDRLMSIIRETKTMIVTESFRFKIPNELKNGCRLTKVPYERWSTTEFTYVERED